MPGLPNRSSQPKLSPARRKESHGSTDEEYLEANAETVQERISKVVQYIFDVGLSSGRSSNLE